ncbi:OmpA family protein [Novosphingobium endophyticum]|nr:OmpA family protein [Novosphingobium endophyticum]
MLNYRKWPASALALGCLLAPGVTLAQDAGSDLMSLDRKSLKVEVQSRFDAALAQTETASVVSADSPAFMWASQAKVQCGIARGFLKSGTKDPVSLGKCDEAYRRMMAPQMVSEAPGAPLAPPAAGPCLAGPYIVFFDWDSSRISPDAVTVLDSAAASTVGCGSATIRIAGYTDRSGSEQYNMGLSTRRAEVVRGYLAGNGATAQLTTQAFGEGNPRVPTADGVREIQNRRVEITVE